MEWLATEICPMVLTDEGLRAALLARCRNLRIEPPGRVERIMGACWARFERVFCLQVLNLLSADSARSLWELATGEDGFLLELKTDPGRLGLETLLGVGQAGGLVAGQGDGVASLGPGGEPAAGPLDVDAALAWSRTSEIPRPKAMGEPCRHKSCQGTW